MSIRRGDTVSIRPSPGLSGVVTSVDGDEVMLCMPIGGSYQLRGPFAVTDLVVALAPERSS